MGALLRTELLMELLARLPADLVAALGWQGTAAVILGTMMSRGLRDGGPRGNRGTDTADTGNAAGAAHARHGADPAGSSGRTPTPGLGVGLACVTTVLLALLLVAGGRG